MSQVSLGRQEFVPGTPPGHTKAISAILARYHVKTGRGGATPPLRTPPLRYYLEKVLRDMGGISHWATMLEISEIPKVWRITRRVRPFSGDSGDFQAKKKEHKDELFGSGDCPVGWESSTRGVVAKKFVPSLEGLSSLGFE